MVVPARSGTTMPRLRRTASCCETEEPATPVSTWISPTLRGPPRRCSRISIRTGWASALKNSALNWRSRSDSSGRGGLADMAAQPKAGPPIGQVSERSYLRRDAGCAILGPWMRGSPRGREKPMTNAKDALAVLLERAETADPENRIDLRDP